MSQKLRADRDRAVVLSVSAVAAMVIAYLLVFTGAARLRHD